MDHLPVQKKLSLELLGWIITLLIIVGVLFPIYQNVADYPFWMQNIVQIVVFVTLARYVFTWRFNLLAHQQYVKVFLAFLCIPLTFYLISALNEFHGYLDEVGFEQHLKTLGGEESIRMIRYLKNENVFFGTGALVATVFFFFRMIVSIWRLHNKGVV